MQNDAAATSISSPSIMDKPTGVGAAIAMYGPLVLVVFLIVIYKIESNGRASTSSALNNAASMASSPNTREIATPVPTPSSSLTSETENKVASDDPQTVATVKTPQAPGTPLPRPYPGWAPPIPGGAYWGVPNQGPTSAGPITPPSFYPYPYYSPHPYPPYGIDPYWWTQPGTTAKPSR